MDGSLSARGKAFVTHRPTFLDVLSDLWDPESNPNGILNIGLAENVRNRLLELDSVANTNLDSYACRNEKFHQHQCKIEN
jgi:hypothetical protein